MKDDNNNLAGLSGALLVMPLYMLSLLFLLFSLWSASGADVNGQVLKLAGMVLIVMIGISVRSWQCLSWMKNDPHRATAMGKKLFLVYIVLSSLNLLVDGWPTDRFEGPLTALSTEQITYGYGNQQQIYVVDPNKTMLYEAGFWSWLSFIFTFAFQLVEEIAIFAFISVLYTKLRGDRPLFTWGHFMHEVSFGQWGIEYNWSEQQK